MSATTEHTTPPILRRRSLPKGYKRIVGILKGRRKSMEAHVTRMRGEWNKKAPRSQHL